MRQIQRNSWTYSAPLNTIKGCCFFILCWILLKLLYATETIWPPVDIRVKWLKKETVLIKFTRHHHHIHTQRTVICTSSHINSKFAPTKEKFPNPPRVLLCFSTVDRTIQKKSAPNDASLLLLQHIDITILLAPSPCCLLAFVWCDCVYVCVWGKINRLQAQQHTHQTHDTRKKNFSKMCFVGRPHHHKHICGA